MGHGFSAAKLDYIAPHINRYVDDGKLAGALCLVTRRGEEAYFHAYGKRDVERDTDITRDTVFRIYSMSKPITSIALMTLYERGLFQLDDPVANYVPKWADLKVYESGEGESLATSACTVPMTIKHLLSHTSGLTYGFMNSNAVDALYRENEVGSRGSLEDMMSDLAEIPLLFTPGTRWNYSVSTDVCGYLVELFSGKALDDYVGDVITGPLGMNCLLYTSPSPRDPE